MYNVNSLWYVSGGWGKKIMCWRNDMLGPGKKRWLTPAMPPPLRIYTYGYMHLLIMEYKEIDN